MFRQRTPEPPSEEGESYFVSMTDMMVGVIFIFIILLSFFALQYRSTTASLIEAKDAQTALLLKSATDLKRENANIEIDRSHHVLCLAARVLVPADTGRRCFAYTGAPTAPPQVVPKAFDLGTFVATDLAGVPVQQSTSTNVQFSADRIFLPGSDTLSGEGQSVAARLAQSLAARLPCLSYGAPSTSGCSGTKLSGVIVESSASFDAFTT